MLFQGWFFILGLIYCIVAYLKSRTKVFEMDLERSSPELLFYGIQCFMNSLNHHNFNFGLLMYDLPRNINKYLQISIAILICDTEKYV